VDPYVNYGPVMRNISRYIILGACYCNKTTTDVTCKKPEFQLLALSAGPKMERIGLGPKTASHDSKAAAQ